MNILLLLVIQAAEKLLWLKVLAGQLFAKGSVEINYDNNSSLLQKVQLIEQRYQFKNLIQRF